MSSAVENVTGRKAVRIAVYVMLVTSALVSFVLGDRLWSAARDGDVPLWFPLLAPATFTAFVVVYSVDRWLLLRRRRYPPGRVFFQLAFAVVFLSLLWPRQAAEFRDSKRRSLGSDYVLRLLKKSDPDVRAAACELLGLRGQGSAAELVKQLAYNDTNRDVRTVCLASLQRLQTNPSP